MVKFEERLKKKKSITVTLKASGTLVYNNLKQRKFSWINVSVVSNPSFRIDFKTLKDTLCEVNLTVKKINEIYKNLFNSCKTFKKYAIQDFRELIGVSEQLGIRARKAVKKRTRLEVHCPLEGLLCRVVCGGPVRRRPPCSSGV